jgi:FixJ family two-component response regulator
MQLKNKISNQLLVIIDDDASIRDSLSLLFSQLEFNVIIFESVEKFFSSTSYRTRCCAIIDLNLDGLTGIDALQIIKNERLLIKTILISAFSTPKFVRDAFISDAFDFIEKPYNPNELIEVVRRAFANFPPNSLNEGVLTKREEEIRTLLLKGMHAKEIAIKLDISKRTVETHKARIFEKLKINSTLELLANSSKI